VAHESTRKKGPRLKNNRNTVDKTETEKGGGEKEEVTPQGDGGLGGRGRIKELRLKKEKEKRTAGGRNAAGDRRGKSLHPNLGNSFEENSIRKERTITG